MNLFHHSELDGLPLESWQNIAYLQFKEKITDKTNPFPCIPAVLGYTLGHLRFGFAGIPESQESAKELAYILKDYTINYKSFGKFTSLIVFFNTPQERYKNWQVEDYYRLFWQQLENLNKYDEQAWPESIPIDPNHPLWEYCFHGTSYFMYCATPAHENRKSRSFPAYMLAITPRSVLIDFLAQEKQAANLKKKIRHRIEKYDKLPIHPALNSYGNSDNFEWKQYFLPDEQINFSECPFKKMIKKSH
ncbi:YqcI/YcgG family protein [Bacillus sp. S/N-304-OC-R1]|uniref:YqcI/YcgG family protein n=1 Tax=Bacillus sp. S/N-304-OC-R1 TaxID=2758034 RepID=UPI001C8EDE5C|nr:YqcI/YcgG family protein [Bacillus sp. S/N-304-OC-R1]MBY0121343.1 YqcI/YcgG family protein [Bacillus sp. S/N-304-OC-R1]